MEKQPLAKTIFLLVYYFGGTMCLWTGAYLIGGTAYLLLAIGGWAISSCFMDRLLMALKPSWYMPYPQPMKDDHAKD